MPTPPIKSANSPANTEQQPQIDRLKRANARGIARQIGFFANQPQLQYPANAEALELRQEINERVEQNNKNGVVNNTGFGPTKITPKRIGSTTQLMTSTRKSDYHGIQTQSSDKWSDYKQWASELNRGSVAQTMARGDQLLQALTTGNEANLDLEHFDQAQCRAAASLVTTTLIAEESRSPGSSKLVRSALRQITEGTLTFEKGFSGIDPVVPLSTSKKEGNPHGGVEHNKRILAGETELTEEQKQVVSECSTSTESLTEPSAENSSDDELNEQMAQVSFGKSV